MFQVLAFTVPGPACLDSAYCGPQEASYRTTPASGDPYRYIQTGSYAKILCAMGGVEGEIKCHKKK